MRPARGIRAAPGLSTTAATPARGADAESRRDLHALPLEMLGWDRARLDAFLHSPSSPLGGRSNIQLRTVGDVNRVLWALKRIAERQVKGSVQK